jgi:Domain of unknown function (DUF4333)
VEEETMKHPAGLLSALIVVPALALSACGEQKLNTTKAEKAIAQGITQQTGAQGVTVNCPNDVKLQAGNKFTCQAKAADGRQGKVSVTQKDDKGNIDWKLNS